MVWIGDENKCLPHARGGVSLAGAGPLTAGPSSPRTWGCFHRRHQRNQRGLVFPTHVGVFQAEEEGGAGEEVFPTHVGVFPGGADNY